MKSERHWQIVFVSRLGGSWRLQFPCKLLSRINSTIILTTVPKKTIHWWKIKLFFRVFALFLVVVLTLLLFFPILFSVGNSAQKSQEKCSRSSGKHPVQRPVHLPQDSNITYYNRLSKTDICKADTWRKWQLTLTRSKVTYRSIPSMPIGQPVKSRPSHRLLKVDMTLLLTSCRLLMSQSYRK